jgi:hypothetical protein
MARGDRGASCWLSEQGGDTMLPRIGIMKAMYPDELTPKPQQETGEKISGGRIGIAAPID